MSNYNANLQANNAELQNILDDINNLPKMDDNLVDTSDATATATDILEGETAYVNGTKITGTIQTVNQAAPTIAVDSNGLITATATQSAGYTKGGVKSATKQLAFQPAKTITPGTASQIAVSSGYYVGGDIVVEGDSNLVASNIKSGVSIFGVNGDYTGSGGTSSTVETCTVTFVYQMLKPSNFSIAYTDANLQSVKQDLVFNYGDTEAITVAKNTIIGNNHSSIDILHFISLSSEHPEFDSMSNNEGAIIYDNITFYIE